MRFWKYEALGNDFIIVNKSPKDPIKLMNRNYGIGADGLIVLSKNKIKIYNSDGSIAKNCGNGLRCVALHLKRYKKDFNIVLDDRIFRIKIIKKKPFLVCVNLGKIGGISKKESYYFVDIGNKHIVTFLEEKEFDLSRYLDYNINFCKIIDNNKIMVRTFERGVGFTNACGTGSAACAIICHKFYNLKNKIEVIFDNGSIICLVDEDVTIIGSAKLVFRGKIK